MAQNIKTVQGITLASTKTIQGIAIANIKTIQGIDNTGGGGGANFSDNFSGTLSNWTQEAGTWDINTGQLRLTDGSFANGAIIFTADTCDTTQGYMRATRGDDGSFPRFIFRYSNDGGAHYAIEIANAECGWYYYPTVGGSPTQIGTDFSTTTGIGTVVAITWTGTGTGTIIRVWIDPTSNTPTSVSDWDGAADHTWTDDPGAPVNSGLYVGIGGSQGTANTLRWDNFFGGDAA